MADGKTVLDVRTAVVGIAMITLMISSAVMGQAGRHIPKAPEPAPVPAATPTQISTSRPAPKPSFVLKVIADLPLSVYQVFPKPEFMPEWAIERLRTSTLLEVHDSGAANRRDAIKMAKSETENYVVWLQLIDDPTMDSGVLGNAAANRLVAVNYEILSPMTGKTKTMGTIRLNQDSLNGRRPSVTTIARNCHQGVYGNDFILLQASIEAAERVMLAFNVPIPPDCKPKPNTATTYLPR